jgi:hypothetical protein
VWSQLALGAARELAPYQSPTFKAIEPEQPKVR